MILNQFCYGPTEINDPGALNAAKTGIRERNI